MPDYKPVSVPLRAAVIRLGRPLLNGSSDLPGSRAGRAAPPPLFGLAPRGVFPAGRITPAAVRSYRTISPLPEKSGGIFSVALSVNPRTDCPAVSRHAALWRPDFPPPRRWKTSERESDCPSGSFTRLLSHDACRGWVRPRLKVRCTMSHLTNAVFGLKSRSIQTCSVVSYVKLSPRLS